METTDGQKFEGSTTTFGVSICTLEDARVFRILDAAAGNAPESDMDGLLKHMVGCMRHAKRLDGEKDLVEVCERRLIQNIPPGIRNTSFLDD